MNPMIRKELRQRMRERRGWILPSLYLLVQCAVVAFVYYEASTDLSDNVQGWYIGVELFLAAAYAQLVLLLFLAPIFSAGALTVEKEQRTLASLLTSLLRPSQIWWGKLVASLAFVMLLLVAGLPVLSTVFAFGGVGPWEVAIATFTIVVILATVSALSLYWSSVFRRSVHATAVSYVSVVFMTVVTFLIFVLERTNRHVDAASWSGLPRYVKAPLYLNPIFFLTMSFVPKDQLYPEWVSCLIVFLVLGVVSALLTLWNLRRSGESL